MNKINHKLNTLKEYQDYLLSISKDKEVREVATNAISLIEKMIEDLKLGGKDEK